MRPIRYFERPSTTLRGLVNDEEKKTPLRGVGPPLGGETYMCMFLTLCHIPTATARFVCCRKWGERGEPCPITRGRAMAGVGFVHRAGRWFGAARDAMRVFAVLWALVRAPDHARPTPLPCRAALHASRRRPPRCVAVGLFGAAGGGVGVAEDGLYRREHAPSAPGSLFSRTSAACRDAPRPKHTHSL